MPRTSTNPGTGGDRFVTDAVVPGAHAVRVVFGVGALTEVAGEALRLGSRLLVVAGAHEDAAADRVCAGLDGAAAGRVRDVEQHVPVALAEAAVAQASRVGADVLVAIGGGSATGLAKAVALTTGLPVLAVPTTYAGSEMTPIWGMTDGGVKSTGRDPRVLPRTVVYDPALTVTLPAALTAASGMNALAHCVEALYAPDVTAELAEAVVDGVAALAQGLRGAVADPADLEARSRALRGAWSAGWALGSTTMGLHHKLAHLIGGAYRLPHAGLHSALLPQVAAYNAGAAPDALAQVARGLGADSAHDAGPALFDLAAELGAPTSLRDLGLPADAIDRLADTAAGLDVVTPRPVDRAGVRALLQAAFDGTRPASTPGAGEDQP